MSGMLFEILFDRKRAKKGIDDTKADAVAMLKEVQKQAEKTGAAIENAVGISQREQNKFFNDVKRGGFSAMVADRNNNFRKQLNEGLKAGMLHPSDFRGNGRKDLMSAFSSGELKRQLSEYKKFGEGIAKVEEKVVGQTATNHKKSMLSQVTEAWKGANHQVDEHGHKLGTVGKIEGNYFSRLRRQIVSTIVAYASYETARRAAEAVFGSGLEREQGIFAGSVAFGNKGNAAAAYNLAQRMGTSGTPFTQKDMIGGFTSMMEAGVDPRKKKNFDLFGNIAGTKGQTLSQTAGDINSAVYGDNDILRKYGVNNAQIFALQHMVDQRPNSRQAVILQMLSSDKRYEHGMRDFAGSWSGMLNQMKNHWDKFLESIIGKSEDKNSLYSKIKEGFQLVLNWFARNGTRIERFGNLIGAVLKRVTVWVTDFARSVAHHVERLLGMTDGSEEQFRDKTMKLVLWLELTKIKVVDFFEKWKWLIKDIAEFWLASKIVKLIVGGVESMISPWEKLYKSIKAVSGVLGLFKKGGGGIKAAAEAAEGAGGGGLGGVGMGTISSFILSAGGLALIAAAAVTVADKLLRPNPTAKDAVASAMGTSEMGKGGGGGSIFDSADALHNSIVYKTANAAQKKIYDSTVEAKSIVKDYAASGDKTLDPNRINKFLGAGAYSGVEATLGKFSEGKDREKALNDILASQSSVNIDKVYVHIDSSDPTKAGQYFQEAMRQLGSRSGQSTTTGRKVKNPPIPSNTPK